jgi:hypothetical protein
VVRISPIQSTTASEIAGDAIGRIDDQLPRRSAPNVKYMHSTFSAIACVASLPKAREINEKPALEQLERRSGYSANFRYRR